ncbi:type 1 periplasmic binding fold superfamily protein [Hyunsoonleella sp. SJ7]|uniref:Type 1 periplasmic binding fold superfamily protein n=1 Tax=Hyunsoonleella aquatilis TaxID=2762758 RepID=A0A923HF26_9FLAO|nr:type 1 periplasmic binding fold superfamily protein [Hyunsoonleella aquatilis]MBC3760001.1 type 1 periplasmic binding fold superfamily protein [Hyunsoonleella aquatilis]
MKTLNRILILAMLVGTFVACDNDDDTPAPVVEEEVITTMTITLTPVGGGTTVTMQTRDTDGDGPNPPVVTDPVNLTANTTYNGSIELLNELETPAEDITEEVEEEDEEHQFFFEATNSIATFAYSDMDADNNPIGLSFTLTTGAAGTGTVTVTLIHEPMKDASGVSNGDMTNAGGEEDITETFNVVVQ